MFELTCGLILKGHFTNDKPLVINPSTIAHARIRTFNRWHVSNDLSAERERERARSLGLPISDAIIY